MRKIFRIAMLVLTLFMVAGCSASSQTETASLATSTAAELGTATADGVTALPEVRNECGECHKEKTKLIETAKVVEEAAESESKGVG